MPLPRSKVGDADFVNDYVAKKQAQMQRAREIREERNKRTEEKQQQQQEQQQHQEELVTKETLMQEERPESHEQQENEKYEQGEAEEEELTHNSSSQHKSKKTKMPLKRSAAGHRERCILQVVEEDFTKATQAGIITPDQARQLWAMFSDQVIRVVPGEPHVNSTVSIESLLTLSNHTSASATTPSSSLCNSVDAFNSVNYNNTNHSNHSSSGSNTNNTSTGFGGSISLESLRQSIANFKKEQKRKGKNNMSKVHATSKPIHHNNFDKSNNDNNNDNDNDDESDKDSNAHVKQKENLYKNEESGDDGADDHAAYFNTGSYLRTLNKGNEQSNITKRSASSSNNNNAKKTRKKPTRPEWNFDVGVADAQEQELELQHEHDNKAMGHTSGNAGVYPNNSGNVKQKQEKSNNINNNTIQRNIKKTSQTTNSDNNNNVTGAQKGKSTALDRKKDNVTTKHTTQYTLQEESALSASTTPTNNTTNNNKTRSHASNNASRFSSSKGSSGMVNLDDIPVGKAAHDANNNVFANWDNAFPDTNQSDAKYNFLTTSSSSAGVTGNGNTKGVSNYLIEHEASAAAQEPLRECSTCGRSFRVSVLPRHEAVCRKQANKKRIAFDMQSQRLDGVEGMNEVRRTTDAFSKNWAKKMNNNSNINNNNNINKTNAQKMPKWKIEHEQFQAAMRAAHMQSALESGSNNNNMNNNMFGKGNPSVLPPPPPPLPPELDNRVLCPHCGRKFAEETAARHIPKCATTIAKPKGIRPIRR